jgi:hypothetical protein
MEDEIQTHTLYEWCFLNKIRPLKAILADSFMLDKITLEEFKQIRGSIKFKENSMPRKPANFLEFRMYGFVPYNISDIQKGIQFNHANDNYSLEYEHSQAYRNFRIEWKTNIILNGGTSNEGTMVRQGFKDTMYYGTMQAHLNELRTNGINVSTFYEPDLNSMLSAMCFLVDERVFNKELYPDFVGFEIDAANIPHFTDLNAKLERERKNWIEKIGGPKNVFLRSFLAGKRLA